MLRIKRCALLSMGSISPTVSQKDDSNLYFHQHYVNIQMPHSQTPDLIGDQCLRKTYLVQIMISGPMEENCLKKNHYSFNQIIEFTRQNMGNIKMVMMMVIIIVKIITVSETVTSSFLI